MALYHHESFKKLGEEFFAAESRIERVKEDAIREYQLEESQYKSQNHSLLATTAATGAILEIRRRAFKKIVGTTLAELMPLYCKYAPDDIMSFRQYILSTNQLYIDELPPILGLGDTVRNITATHYDRFKDYVTKEFTRIYTEERIKHPAKKRLALKWLKENAWWVVTGVFAIICAVIYSVISAAGPDIWNLIKTRLGF